MARKTKYAEETQQVSMRLPQTLLATIDTKARRDNAPRAEVIVKALKKGLRGEPVTAPAETGDVFE